MKTRNWLMAWVYAMALSCSPNPTIGNTGPLQEVQRTTQFRIARCIPQSEFHALLWVLMQSIHAQVEVLLLQREWEMQLWTNVWEIDTKYSALLENILHTPLWQYYRAYTQQESTTQTPELCVSENQFENLKTAWVQEFVRQLREVLGEWYKAQERLTQKYQQQLAEINQQENSPSTPETQKVKFTTKRQLLNENYQKELDAIAKNYIELILAFLESPLWKHSMPFLREESGKSIAPVWESTPEIYTF